MTHSTQHIKTGAFAFLVLIVFASDLTDAKVILFKFQNDIRLHLRNYGPTVETFKIIGNFFLQQGNDIKQPFNAQLTDVKILRSDIYGHNNIITNCSSFDKTIKALTIPFSIIYREFFVIKGLKFSKDDTQFSKNFKLAFMTNKIQFNLSKLIGNHEFTEYSNETSMLGDCQFKYSVRSSSQSKNVSFEKIQKSYTGVCEEKVSANKQFTLGGICNTGKEKNFRVKVNNDGFIKLNKGMSTILNVLISEQRSFAPWKGSQSVFVAEYNSKVDYQGILESNLLPESIDTTDEFVYRSFLSKPNKELLQIKNPKLSNLVETYRALGCDASFETGTRELVEEVLKCYLPK